MERLKINDFINYRFLSDLEISPDKNNTAFIVHKMNLGENNYDSNIYIFNEKENKTLQITSMNDESSFTWKNNQTLVFPSYRCAEDKDRIKNFQEFTPFYEININGGEAVKSFEIPMKVTSFKFIDDDNLIITAKFDHNREYFDSLSQEEKEESTHYMIMDELPFWSNGVGGVNKIRNRAYTYNITNNKLEEINDIFSDTLDIKLNSTKSQALIISKSYKDIEPLTMSLSLYDIKNQSLKTLDSDNYKYHFADFIEDKVIFIATDMNLYGLNENPHIFTMDLNGDNINQITTTDFDTSIGSSVGSDCRYGKYTSAVVDKQHIYFTSTEGGCSHINKMDLEGNLLRLTENIGSIDGIDVLDGQIRFIGLRNLNLQELYSLKEEKERKLTSFNDWVQEKRSLSKPKSISFETDGVSIDGWVLEPINANDGEKYPTILNIHGGPKTVFGEVYFHEMQYWANEGYAVIFCNPRGSDGKGNEFADIRGKYGTIDFDDLMNFTDLCIEKFSFIDKNRLAVAGGSYGGFMTNWVIGHTNRFKAAASQRSIANWFSFFGTTDIGYFFTGDQQASNPWNNPEKLWEHSPMKYANKVTTPTLFIHSDEDFRCWTPEALQMFSSLKYHGVDSRVCLFKGENHELSRSGKPKHRIKRLKEITTWFDKYLKI